MVLFPNTNITVYNKFYNIIEDIEQYQKTIIKDVDWQNKVIATDGNKGVTLTNSTLIFIDKIPNYISPKKFLKLSDEERKNYFTLALEDIIVKGQLDFELTGRKGNNVATLNNNFDDAVTIVSVEPFKEHYEVTCK